MGSGAAGVSGAVRTANSLVGSTANDQSGDGNGSVTALTNGNYVVTSPNWSNDAGAVTWGSGTADLTGVVSSMNSAIGSVANSGLGNVVQDSVNGTFFVPFVTDGGGRVLVGSQTTGFPAAADDPDVDADADTDTSASACNRRSVLQERLDLVHRQLQRATGSSAASNSGLYEVFAAVTKIVKKHKETLFTKALAIRSVSLNSTSSTVTINLAKPFKGRVEVMVQGNITAGNGASNSVRFTQDLRLSMHRDQGRERQLGRSQGDPTGTQRGFRHGSRAGYSRAWLVSLCRLLLCDWRHCNLRSNRARFRPLIEVCEPHSRILNL